jgi:hypothetical protein
MMFEEATWFAIAAQVVGFVVWIVRLEGKVNELRDKHDACQVRRQVNEDRVILQLNKMDVLLAELSTDMKWLVNGKKENKKEAEREPM